MVESLTVKTEKWEMLTLFWVLSGHGPVGDGLSNVKFYGLSLSAFFRLFTLLN